MFDIGWAELLVIAMVAIVVVGPRDLPRLMHKAGQWMTKARKMASHFQAGIEEMARQAELEELRKEAKTIERDLTQLDPSKPLGAGSGGGNATAAPAPQVGNSIATPTPKPAPPIEPVHGTEP
ncbi:MAG TPA: Sec-independent protein translocase protein TatB [Micropepsaceae bacterium]|nr:Sec-independent protein translocase protein TatB [Micropepsaceae bacterium]